ncbi:MAG TPA: hypothetical protein PKK76_13370 [Leptospiraceae bacterium]|nr:hypothetical protein [Leptospiraceae bacterium]
MTSAVAQPINPFHKAPPAEPAAQLFSRQEMHRYLDRMNPIEVPGEDRGKNLDLQA